MRIVYKDKRHSSGLIRDGEMVLYISNRLPRAVQQAHIDALTQKLQARLKQRATVPDGPPPGLTPSSITDNASLLERAEFWNNRFYGFPMNRVAFRKQDSRWGSCSGLTRNINISHRLAGGPLELLDYVLIHEICHLQEMNHGPRFWSLVGRACPDYRAKRQVLREYDLWLRFNGQ